MLKFIKDKFTKTPDTPAQAPAAPAPQPQAPTPKGGWLSRLTSGLARTRNRFASGITTLLLGQKSLSDDLFEEIETYLLSADVGIEATQHIINTLTEQASRKALKDGAGVLEALKDCLHSRLADHTAPLVPEGHHPFVILVVGVNGTGKTTTIGKLAKYYQTQGKKVMLAAGDTFRAAAIEQLQHWGEQNNISVVAGNDGGDSAAILYDAFEAAKARNMDILIADTAGRLHTKHNLMEELKKLARVLKKIDPNAPHETLMVLDATIGQNALTQAQQFNAAVPLTGLAITKLDGTAKGGMIFALTEHLKCPIRFIGVGEGIDDLQPFDATDFINALFETD